MKILIVSPTKRFSRKGNRVTARRWQTILRSQNHIVHIRNECDDQPYDLLIALHGDKSAAAIQDFHDARNKPIILLLTGTDIHQKTLTSKTKHSISIADQLVVLQPCAISRIPKPFQEKATVVYQSAIAPRRLPKKLSSIFELTVIGHLREVKDPFRAALAARQLAKTSRIQVIQFGAALSDRMEDRAIQLSGSIPRYHWHGSQPRWKTLQHLARSQATIISSKSEGGASVISEAIACDVPVLASRIDGNRGILGDSYSGYFEVGKTRELSRLMERCESEPSFLKKLRHQIRGKRNLVTPEREARAIKRLLTRI